MLRRLLTKVNGWKRAKAVREIGGAAQFHGYDAEKAIRRLDYASFVSPERKYVYLETPKVACTAFKQMIVDLEGVKFDRKLRPYLREARMDMLIHQRDYIALPSIVDLSADDRKKVLGGSDDWFVFALVRNPFSRIVSVFESKIRLSDPYFNNPLRSPEISPHSRDRIELFQSFVRKISTNEQRIAENPHISSQRDLLMPLLINYSSIFKLESIADALAAFNAHLSKSGMKREVELPRNNIMLKTNWRAYYDDRSAGIIAHVFEKDFEAFGYDPHDWRPLAGETLPPETDAERFWRSQVVARNEMIEHLYQLMDEQMGKPKHWRYARH